MESDSYIAPSLADLIVNGGWAVLCYHNSEIHVSPIMKDKEQAVHFYRMLRKQILEQNLNIALLGVFGLKKDDLEFCK